MYLVFDTETGGIPKEVTLLTAWFGVYNKDFKLVNELDLRLKPDDGLYVINPEALKINNIDLIEHDRVAVTYKQGATHLYNFLKREQSFIKEKLIPVGHNVGFDIAKVTENLVSRNSWEQFVSYRPLDTCVIAQFLRVTGKLPQDLSASLGTLVEYFGIGIEVAGVAHEARYDAVATMKVLKNLMRLV